MDLFKTKYSRPIEREFEHWIIEGIEMCFKRINKNVTIFALSPIIENEFPADQAIIHDFKLIGLQFKKASLGKLRYGQKEHNSSNLCWDMAKPTGQFDGIKSNDSFFYCLPTFTNRNYKSVALDHCIFWQPDRKQVSTTYWYDNQNVINNNGTLRYEGLRWGELYEGLLNCNIGSRNTAQSLRRRLFIDSFVKDQVDISLDGFYALIVEL